jgi:cyclopropane fatty-acyl-phospholipid synthase-like methyltransferase
MEIGSGTGYFSFRLAQAGASVIAADVDERFQQYIKLKKDSLGISDEELVLRQVPYDTPNLQEAEVDMVLLVNTYHHIEDRSKYFAKVKQGLKERGQLIVIDFFKKELPVGPPMEMKMTTAQVIDELKEAGFEQFDTKEDLLAYQYMIMAQ